MNDDTRQPTKQSDQAAMIIRGILTAEGEAIGCEECFEFLEQCADLVEAGQNIEDVYPEVKRHLNGCMGCQEEFEALLSALDAARHSGT
jgi:hypothetical protein